MLAASYLILQSCISFLSVSDKSGASLFSLLTFCLLVSEDLFLFFPQAIAVFLVSERTEDTAIDEKREEKPLKSSQISKENVDKASLVRMKMLLP